MGIYPAVLPGRVVKGETGRGSVGLEIPEPPMKERTMMDELNKALTDITTGKLIQSPVAVATQAVQRIREIRASGETISPEEHKAWKELLEHLVEEEKIDGIENLIQVELPLIPVDYPLPDLDEEPLPDIDFK